MSGLSIVTTVAVLAIATFAYISHTGSSFIVIVGSINLPLAATLLVTGLALAYFCGQKKAEEVASVVIPTSHPKVLEMNDHVHNIKKYTQFEDSFSHPQLRFKPLNLTECTCQNSAFNRLHNSRRDDLENAIVKRLAVNYPNKSEPISILSMGSGGLMSDFITLEKLILAGFKKINIALVDPKIDLEAVKRIDNFFKGYPDVIVELEGFKNVDDVSKGDFSAVIAVDYNDLTSFVIKEAFVSTEDLIKAKRKVAERGFIALGFSEEDSIIGQVMEPASKKFKSSFILTLTADLEKELKKSDGISITIPNIFFAGGTQVFFFSLALALDRMKHSYQNMTISTLDGVEREVELRSLLTALFPKSFLTIDRVQTGNKYDLFFSGVNEEILKSKKYLDHIKPDALTYILGRNTQTYRQKGLNETDRKQIR